MANYFMFYNVKGPILTHKPLDRLSRIDKICSLGENKHIYILQYEHGPKVNIFCLYVFF